MRTHRQTVAAVAGPGIAAARDVYLTTPSEVVRVAALVEIASAAAALARTIVKLRHLDPEAIAAHVTDRGDLRAVLGRGQWLPTMTRHVPAPPTGPVDLGSLFPDLPALCPDPGAHAPRRRPTRVPDPGQLALLPEQAAVSPPARALGRRAVAGGRS
jgi:hypothetical protein